MDLDVCEPPVKKERLDNNLEMVNYEMQIDVPVATGAEIDPLLPVDTDQVDTDQVDRVQPSHILEVSQPINSERTHEVRQEIYISSDEEIEEITTEPTTQKFSREASAAEKQHASIQKTQLMTPPFDLLQTPDPAVNGFSPLSSNASQHLTHSTNTLQGQKHPKSFSTNLPVSINRPANSKPNAPPLVEVMKFPGALQTPTNAANALVKNQSKWQPYSQLSRPNKLLPIPMSVKRLLEAPFMSGAWTNNQRKDIIKFSRPKPAIKLSSDLSAERFYSIIPWLCGSLHTKTFHCWPCLLFSYPPVSVELWYVKTFQVLTEGFNQLWKAHEASHDHQTAEHTLNIWLQSLNAPSLSISHIEPTVTDCISDLADLSSSDYINRQTHSMSNTVPVLEHSGTLLTASPSTLFQSQSEWQLSSSVAMASAPSHPSNNLLPKSNCQPSSSVVTREVPSSHPDPQNILLPISIPISVSSLVKTPLLSDAWTFEQKKVIIKSPRPQPLIKLSPITLPGVSAERLYSEIPWLCGSSNLGKFFCWPCLLFFYKPESNELWSVPKSQVLEEGFNQRREAHEGSYAHKAAEKKLKIWLQSMGASPHVNSNNKPAVRNFSCSERVSRNRKLLSLLVQSVCHLRNKRNNVQMNEYAEYFWHNVLSDGELRETLRDFQGDLSFESAADFVWNHAGLVEDAVGKFVKSKISDEIKDARFVTLFMEDLSSIVEKSSVAVIAHFVDQKGDAQERIIGFTYEITYDRSADTIFTLLQSIVFEFGFRLKVAGFTYSATLVHPSEITAFNRRVERLCPVAKCFHYQRHNLVGMLFGTLSHLIFISRDFFVTITEFQTFFKENFKLLSSKFYHFEQQNSRSKLSHPKYDFDYGFITTLKKCYSSVLQTLSNILASPNCPNRISLQGQFFMSFLQDINTRFMITLISQLNSATADVSEALQGNVDTKKWKLMIRQAIGNLVNMKNFGFEDIYLTALSPVLVRTQVRASDSPKDLVTTFHKMMNTAIIFLHRRFDTVNFGYVDLETVAERYYERMNLSFEDKDKVRSQIRDKTLAEAVKHFHAHNLAAVVPEYAAFLDFAMTIPSSSSSLHCPAVDRILKYQRDRSCKPPKNLIWMEKKLLTDISRQRRLCEAVIDILATYRCSGGWWGQGTRVRPQ